MSDGPCNHFFKAGSQIHTRSFLGLCSLGLCFGSNDESLSFGSLSTTPNDLSDLITRIRLYRKPLETVSEHIFQFLKQQFFLKTKDSCQGCMRFHRLMRPLGNAALISLKMNEIERKKFGVRTFTH